MTIGKWPIFWMVFGLLMGFLLGGAFVSAWLAPPPIHAEQNADTAQGPDSHGEKGHEEVSLWVPTNAAEFFTLWIAAFTCVLAISTIALWAATRRTARISEKALTDLERPVVFIEITEPGLFNSYSGLRSKIIASNKFRYEFVNAGRTPARLIQIYLTGKVQDSFPEPVDPNNHEVRPRGLPEGCVAVSGKPYFEETDFPEAIFDLSVFRTDNADDVGVYLIGYLKYADIFENRYVYGFCLAFDTIQERFMRRGGHAYNYTRKEPRKEARKES